ncbi:MAG TPA: GNAT family N-acetyltransferase [Trueperaceae bacterium]
MEAKVRLCRPDDLDAVYEICLLTGDAGSDASHLYADPLLPGHLYAAPYVTLEPEHAFVLEDEAGVCGYVVGALDTRDFRRRMIELWLPPLQAKLPLPNPDREAWTAADHIYHQVHFPRQEYPEWLDVFPSHLHIDLLPRAQRQGHGRAMMERFLGMIARAGSPGVHLGLDPRNDGARAFYRALGFNDFDAGTEGSVRMVRPLP